MKQELPNLIIKKSFLWKKCFCGRKNEKFACGKKISTDLGSQSVEHGQIITMLDIKNC